MFLSKLPKLMGDSVNPPPLLFLVDVRIPEMEPPDRDAMELGVPIDLVVDTGERVNRRMEARDTELAEKRARAADRVG